MHEIGPKSPPTVFVGHTGLPSPKSRASCTPVMRPRASPTFLSGNWLMSSATIESEMVPARFLRFMADCRLARVPTTISSTTVVSFAPWPVGWAACRAAAWSAIARPAVSASMEAVAAAERRRAFEDCMGCPSLTVHLTPLSPGAPAASRARTGPRARSTRDGAFLIQIA